MRLLDERPHLQIDPLGNRSTFAGGGDPDTLGDGGPAAHASLKQPRGLALAADGSESTDAWGDFLDELKTRGLRPPLLVISDGAAGLINAAESALPRSLRQRCLIHRCRNYLAKLPAEVQTEMRDVYWAIFDTDELIAAGTAPGHDLVAAVQRRRPSAVVVAVPVASSDAVASVRAAGARVVCPWVPPSFRAVGDAYVDFGQTPDDDVVRALDAAAER